MTYIKNSKDFGRGIYFTNECASGNTVFREKACLDAISPECLPYVCSYCLKVNYETGFETNCQLCKLTFYCNSDCKNFDSNRHKNKICDLTIFYQKNNFINETLIGFGYLLVDLFSNNNFSLTDSKNDQTNFLKSVVDSEKEFFDVTKLNFLESKPDKLSLSKYSSYIEYLKVLLNVDEKSIIFLFGVFQNNCFACTNDYGKVFSIGCFIRQSLLNHACDYNCLPIFSSIYDVTKKRYIVYSQVRSIKKIDTDQQCFIPYIDIFKTPEQRNDILFNEYGFRCNCMLCDNFQCSVLSLKHYLSDFVVTKNMKDRLEKEIELFADGQNGLNLDINRVPLEKSKHAGFIYELLHCTDGPSTRPLSQILKQKIEKLAILKKLLHPLNSLIYFYLNDCFQLCEELNFTTLSLSILEEIIFILNSVLYPKKEYLVNLLLLVTYYKVWSESVFFEPEFEYLIIDLYSIVFGSEREIYKNMILDIQQCKEECEARKKKSNVSALYR